ncbi:MAG: hypothetical protein QXJ69_02040 [Desulfurococcaceae archaeon]
MQTNVELKPFKLIIRGFDEDKEGHYGTLLTLANGRISVKGLLELTGSRNNVAFMAGLYNNVPIWRRELIVLPAVNNVYINNAQKESIEYVERTLDMFNGVLTTYVKLRHPNTSYFSESLVHRVHKNIYMQRISVSSSKILTITLPIENSLNPFLYGYTYTEHLRRKSVDFQGNKVSITYETRDSGLIVEVSMLIVTHGAEDFKHFITRDSAGFMVEGRDFVIEKYVLFRRINDEKTTEKINFVNFNWAELSQRHKESWNKLWEEIGLVVEGDEYVAGALSLYTFHLLQLIDDEAEDLMIPARGLHGLGYRGHVFWDTDVYLLPFLGLVYPEGLRKILNFRCRTLNSAVKYAAETGFKGARFPWESVDDGYESTPRYYPVDLNKCECVDILTGEQEIHISGDIAFALDFYYKVSGDREFMQRCGLKMLVEIARFWASRVEYDQDKKSYVIRNVIGPDEYHVGVSNSYYTNYLAKYSLEAAARYVVEFSKDDEFKPILTELGITWNEVENWFKLANGIYEGRVHEKVIEEFEGYFELADPDLNSEGIRRVDVKDLEDVGKTKLVKQADVVLALILKEIVEGVDPETLKRNYEYYSKYTTHESSLSLPIYATAGFMINDPSAMKLFINALKTDIENIYGNTHEGFHVATAGGIWYAVIFGILGVRLRGNELIVDPKAMNGLRIGVNLRYKGRKLRLSSS